MIQSLGRELDAVLLFDVETEELVRRRLSGRTTCDSCQRPFFGREPGQPCGCTEHNNAGHAHASQATTSRRPCASASKCTAQTAPVIDWYAATARASCAINAVGTLDEVEARALAGLGPSR
jgi:adenylate kinase